MTNVVMPGEHWEAKPFIFPNPCTDQAQLAFPKAWAGAPIEVEILSSSGSPLYRQSVVANNEISISTGNWASGIYWVHCREVGTGRLFEVAPLKVSR